jgi:ribosome biogenesis GTPase
LSASNLDQVLIVNSTVTPELNLRLLDRILVACERSDFTAIIIINKVDLLPDRSVLAEVHRIYEPLGYQVIETSVETNEGVDDLRGQLGGKTSVLAGMSGVGKSSLLNAIQPGLQLKARSVSEATGKGRHTTTRSELLPLDGGGYVVDTPGIREFGIEDLKPYEVGLYFPEFRECRTACHFRTCTHTHEKICAVRDAVETGKIHPHRFESYLRIIESD